ncbi:MAG: type II toxin-antitoxin system VapC family toxin [Candidatus Limnocylindria bacterium]
MTLFYADTSALARAYLADEADHAELRSLLLEGRNFVVTSEITRLELASAVRAASAGGRLSRWRELLTTMDADLADGGAVSPLDLRPNEIFPTAYRYVLDHRLRPLDAIHLAVCSEECPPLAGDDDVVFVTRDDVQADAARAIGLRVS